MKLSEKLTDEEIIAVLTEQINTGSRNYSVRWFSFIKDPVRRLKVYLQFSFGPLYTGEDNEGWTRSAKDVLKLAKGGK